MYFEIISEITEVQTFATSRHIRELPRLNRTYGKGRWRKRKGYATVRLASGEVCNVELHWYEASGLGKKEFKIKRYID